MAGKISTFKTLKLITDAMEGGDREGRRMYKPDWEKHMHEGVLHQA